MTQAEKLKRARQLLKQIINQAPTKNERSGEQCYYCGRYTTELGNIVDETQEAHASDCLITEITSFLLED
jgi:hypothetical protein